MSQEIIIKLDGFKNKNPAGLQKYLEMLDIKITDGWQLQKFEEFYFDLREKVTPLKLRFSF